MHDEVHIFLNIRKYLISWNMLIFDSYAIIFQPHIQSKVHMQSTLSTPPPPCLSGSLLPANKVCGMLCFYTCLSFCPQGEVWYPSMPCSRSWGGVVSQIALQVSRPTPRGEVEGDLAGGVSRPTHRGKLRGIWPGGSPDPHPRGELRGIWSGGSPGPHPGEVEGDLASGGLQAHTQGGELRGIWPGGSPNPHPRGGVEGDLVRGVSRPTPRGSWGGSGQWGSPGPHPRGGVEGDLARGVSRPTRGGSIPACTEADNPPPMATAAGGTHPTAMHSCFVLNFKWASTFYQVRSFHKTECKVENQS